jgi:hypothetical protein
LYNRNNFTHKRESNKYKEYIFKKKSKNDFLKTAKDCERYLDVNK